MRKRFILQFAGLALCMCATLAAQSRDEVLTDFDQAEETVFQLKNQGQYGKALDSQMDLLLDLFRVRAITNEAVRAELEARGECYLEMLFNLSLTTARFQEVSELLKQMPEDSPHLNALGNYVNLHMQLHMGKLDQAAELRDSLGFIRDWLLIGPFDNERGGGFDTAFGPEKEMDLTAEYDGKERRVGWRTNPRTSLTGYVDLNALFNPNDQCLAYALAFVDSDKAQEAALHLSSDEAIKVFFNTREVYALNARRLHNFDQDVIGLKLRKGVNAILLKVCDQNRGWGFSARITAPSGAALEGVTVMAELPPTLPDYGPAGLPAPEPVKVSRGALDYFEAQTVEGRERAHFYLGFLHYLREYKGENQGLATLHLNSFLEEKPKHVFGNYLLALSMARRYDIRAERDENKWRVGLEETLALDPDNVECLHKLGRYYLDSLNVPNRAQHYARTALDANPGYLPASYLLAAVYREKSLNALSDKLIVSLSHNPEYLADPKLRVKLGDLYRMERKIEEAAEQWKTALAADFTTEKARSELIELAIETGRLDEAKALLNERLAIYPYYTDSLRRLAELARSEEDGRGALTYLEQILEITPEDDEALKLMGDIHHELGEDDQALAAYKKALEINPKFKDLRRYVEFLFEGERAFEDDFKLDVLSLIAAYPIQENVDNDSHEYLGLQDVIKVNPDGTSSHYHQEVVRILNHEGASVFDYFATFYTPGEQKCRIQTARVIHPNGTVEEAKINNTERGARPEYGDRAPSVVDMPPLQTGDVVDLSYRKDDLKQSFFGDYFGHRHFFQKQDLRAVKDSRLSLILPLDRDFELNQLNLEFQPEVDENLVDRTETLSWSLSDLPKIDREIRMPGQVEYTPCVEVSTYSSWDDFGQWWWNLTQDQCDMNDAMREKVAELTEGLVDKKDKVRAIYNFVVSHIRYSDAWEFGIHGFKPYRASAIFANRFGDCKDKAILIKSLLNEVGIEAYPVLIRLSGSRSREDLTLPLVSHFNHAITYVPEMNGAEGMFLDGTAQFHPMDTVPAGDCGATVFVIQDGPGKVVTIPYPAPDANFQENLFDVEIAEDGSAAIALHHNSRGMFESGIRAGFLNPGKRAITFEKAFGRVFGEVTIDEVEFSDVENLNEPLAYDVKMGVVDFLLKSGERYQLRSVIFPSGIGSMAADDDRTFDLIMGAPYTFGSRIQYRLPQGFKAAELPPDTVLDNDFASFSLTYEKGEEGVITVSRTVSFKATRLEPSEYEVFRDFCREAERAEEKWIQISKNQVSVNQ